MKDFIEFKDDFVGAGDFTDRYGVEGTPAPSATTNGAVLTLTGAADEEEAIHLGDNLQVDSALLTEFFAEFNIGESTGVADGNTIFIGLIGAAYDADIKGLAKYAGFEIAASGSANKTITFVGDDDIAAIAAVDAGELLATRSNRVCINLARGWEQAEVSVNGNPVGGYIDLTGIKNTNLQLVAQVKGDAANTLTLSCWSFRARKAI